MNDKIKELAIRAGGIWKPGYVEQHNGDHVWQEKVHIDTSDIDLNKFAISIVKECISTVEFAMDYTDYSDPEKSQVEIKAQRWCRDTIKEVFGIK